MSNPKSDTQIETVEKIPPISRNGNGRVSKWQDEWETLMAAKPGEINKLTFKSKTDMAAFCQSGKKQPFNLVRRTDLLAVYCERIESV